MLKTMRKNVKSLAPTLWLVIVAFVITIFAVWGGAGRLGESKTKSTIAKVGKDKISAELYYQSLMQRLEMLREKVKDIDKNLIQQLNIPQQVLELIIQRILLLQVANELGVEALPGEIRERIISYPVFQKDGKFVGFEEYKKILSWNRISISEFEESLKESIVLDKIIKVLTPGITITTKELWETYKTKNETAKLEYVTLEVDKIELIDEPLPSEIREYFEKDKEKYKIPEKREAMLVFLNTEDLKNEIELTETEINKYYKENLSQFKDPERVKVSRIYLPYGKKDKELIITDAQSILEKIKNGEDFGELAIKHSKDEKAKEGGDWGPVEWQKLSSMERQEIKNLSEGETSDILELDVGISILKVTEKKPSSTKPLEEVNERIKIILEGKKARETAEERISKLKKSAQKEKNLELAAQKNGLKIQNTGLLKEGEGVEDIDPSGAISKNLFQLKEKEISPPFHTYKGVGVAQLSNIEALHQASFEEVEDQVKEEVIAQKKKEKAYEKIKKIRSELKREALENLAEKYDLEYNTADEHMREQYLAVIGENSKIDQLAFSLPLKEESDPVEFEKGYALLRVLDRKVVTKEDFEKDKETEKENMLDEKKNKLIHSYILKLREERVKDIKYDLILKINSDILSRYEETE